MHVIPVVRKLRHLDGEEEVSLGDGVVAFGPAPSMENSVPEVYSLVSHSLDSKQGTHFTASSLLITPSIEQHTTRDQEP